MSQARSVAFASDRVGVGQSMALASIALILASNGRRVLAIDWDLAKPSLFKYFAPFLQSEALESNDGLIDLIWSYAIEARRVPSTRFSDLHSRFAPTSAIRCDLPRDLLVRDGGSLHLLSAGREPGRSFRVHYFDWGEFIDGLDGDGLLATFWKELERHYDHILIDCTQLSNASRFPILNASVLVTCFTLDRESMEAAANLARWAAERTRTRRLYICPLTMRYSTAETELLHQAFAHRRRLFQQFDESALIPSGVRDAFQVPETPYHQYQRVLPPLLGPGNASGVYRLLAAALVGQEDIEWPVLDERERSAFRAAYEADENAPGVQVQPLLPPYSGSEAYAFVSYAREDRDKVRPLLQELQSLGWHLWWDEAIPGGSEWESYLKHRLSGATHVLLFLSARSVSSGWVAEEIRIAHDLGKPFLSVMLDWCELPKHLSDVLSRYQMLDESAPNFREQLGRGMRLLQGSPGPI